MTKKNDELAHFGVKGQKWGIRRYQNPDGTLTAAGKAKYRKYADKTKNSIARARQFNGYLSEAIEWREQHNYPSMSLKDFLYDAHVIKPKFDSALGNYALSKRKALRYAKKMKNMQKKLSMDIDDAFEQAQMRSGDDYSDVYDLLNY